MAKETKTQTKEEGPRSFGVFLHDFAGGSAEKELSRELYELIKTMRDESRMRDSDMRGELSLKLKFLVPPAGVVIGSFEVTKKLPKRAVPKGYCYVTEGGNLTHQNPEQKELKFREVNAPAAREVADDEDDARAPREA